MTYMPNECYVDVWREPDFRGETRRLYGPAAHPHLLFSEGSWGDDIGSLRVGPHAFVMVYRGENFTEALLTLGPNDEVRDLSAHEFNDAIDSLKLVHSLKIFDRLYRDEEPDATSAGEGPTGETRKRRRGGS